MPSTRHSRREANGRPQRLQTADSAAGPVDLRLKAEIYRENVKQLCDGDLTYLERKQAEQRIIEELQR